MSYKFHYLRNNKFTTSGLKYLFLKYHNETLKNYSAKSTSRWSCFFNIRSYIADFWWDTAKPRHYLYAYFFSFTKKFRTVYITTPKSGHHPRSFRIFNYNLKKSWLCFFSKNFYITAYYYVWRYWWCPFFFIFFF